MVKDETGKVYGRLTVIERGPNTKSGSARWWCQCSCGNKERILVLGSSLRNGHTKSCGCLHKETAKKQGLANRKQNKYEFEGSLGIGYTSKNEKFYFDSEDYDKIKDFCWYINNNGYVVCKRDKIYLLHRVILNSAQELEIDHINHIKTDNRKKNLRICSSSENKMNQGCQVNSTSGVRGVYWYSNIQKWSAEIVVNKQKFFLGLFNKKEEAIIARKEAEKKYYGNFYYEGSDAAYENY